MEYIKSEEANEDLLFREEVMRQFEYFYQYMHGDRKEPNEVTTELAKNSVTEKTIVLCMKGIEIGTDRRLSQVASDVLDHSNHIAVWLGPGHVQEFYRGVPNCMVIDSNNEFVKDELIRNFSSEIARLIVAMGGNAGTIYGLCHLGDYEATLFSEHSHNLSFGKSVVQGKDYDKLAEGYYTVKAIRNLGRSCTSLDNPL